jgi:hypothetical protein
MLLQELHNAISLERFSRFESGHHKPQTWVMCALPSILNTTLIELATERATRPGVIAGLAKKYTMHSKISPISFAS